MPVQWLCWLLARICFNFVGAVKETYGQNLIMELEFRLAPMSEMVGIWH